MARLAVMMASSAVMDPRNFSSLVHRSMPMQRRLGDTNAARKPVWMVVPTSCIRGKLPTLLPPAETRSPSAPWTVAESACIKLITNEHGS